MADTVRYMMEEMIPELEDMVKQKYFSRKEVKQIVKRRQDFEYLLKRRAGLKEDFLRCACSPLPLLQLLSCMPAAAALPDSLLCCRPAHAW
jgi:U3 small nucleolar RNA-associated protein 6